MNSRFKIAILGFGLEGKSVKKYLKSAKVISLACPLFVPFVEEGEIKSNGLKETAREYLSKLKINLACSCLQFGQ